MSADKKQQFRVYINFTGTVCVDVDADSLAEAREIAEDFDLEDFVADIDRLYGEIGDVLPIPDRNPNR